jgi:hypothetical protein
MKSPAIRILNIAEASLGKKRLNPAFTNSENQPFSDCPCYPPRGLHLHIAQSFVVEIVKYHRAARSGMIGDKSQRAIDAFWSKVHGHTLPDEQCFAMLVVATGEQTLGERLGIEVHRDEADVISLSNPTSENCFQMSV